MSTSTASRLPGIVLSLTLLIGLLGVSVDSSAESSVLKVHSQCPSTERSESFYEVVLWILKPIVEPTLKVVGDVLGKEVEKALKGPDQEIRWSASVNTAMYERAKDGVRLGFGCIILARGAMGKPDITKKFGGDFWDKPGGQTARARVGLTAPPSVYIELKVEADTPKNPSTVALVPVIVYVSERRERTDLVVAVRAIGEAGAESKPVYGFQAITWEGLEQVILRQGDEARPNQASGYVSLPGIDQKTLSQLSVGQKHRPVLIRADVVETTRGKDVFERLRSLTFK